VIELLKDERVDPSTFGSEALILACCNNHENVVKELLKDRRVDPTALNNESLVSAYYIGNFEILSELFFDKRTQNNMSKKDKNMFQIYMDELSNK